jgi:hypothetical protein
MTHIGGRWFQDRLTVANTNIEKLVLGTDLGMKEKALMKKELKM